jgi:hypothetical protein
MKTVSNTDWSYLAAMFDGEGTFSIWSHKGISSSGMGYDSTGFRISVCNTNEGLMEWLVSTFGGVYYSHRRQKEHHKIAYDWRPKGRKNTENVLLGILPYLKIKREQAQISLEYVRLQHNNGYDEGLAIRRRELMNRIQKLNQRGLSVTTNTLNGVSPIGETLKIESELMGDHESAPDVSQVS